MLEKVVGEASIPVDADADQEDQEEFRRFLNDINPAALIRHSQSQKPAKEDSSDFPNRNNNPKK